MILRFYLSVFSLPLVWNDKIIIKTVETIFDHISKHLERRQNTTLCVALELPSRCLEMWSNTVSRV